MTSKTSYTLCSSPSLKNSQNLANVLDSSVTKNLYLAQKKLTPVIDDVMKTAKENSKNRKIGTSYYLTVEQYEDAVWASKILKEADEVFVKKNGRFLKKQLNVNHFNLEKKNVKINKFGKIYVDTAILIQLIELHTSLGEIIHNIQNTPSEAITTIGTSSYTQTDCSNELFNSFEKNNISEDKLNVAINLQKKDSVELLKASLKTNKGSCGKTMQFIKKTEYIEENTQQDEADELLTSIAYPLEGNFLVMSAHTIKSTSLGSDCKCECPKNNLSTLSEERTSNSEVKLSESRQSTRKTKSTGSIRSDEKNSKVTDVAGARNIIVKCLSDLAKVRSFFEMERVEVGVSADVQIQNLQIQQVGSNKGVTVTEVKSSHQSQNSCPATEPEGSKLIICIKGKDETEDVQIIIRQCSDCKSVKISDEADKVDKVQSQTKLNYESDILHGKDRETCSVSSSDVCYRKKSGLNVLFDPDDPSKSIVEPHKKESAQNIEPIYEAVEPGQDIDTPLNNISEDEDYSRIKLYETTNLCVSTEDGQELVISLTIRPKTSNPVRKLSLKDIFSESTTRVNNNNVNKKICTNPDCNRVATDRVIPLARTKICSSLEFDVSVMDTRMRNRGIKHLNPNIVVRLQELGVNNLLRACRPVKCGRHAVLNETLRKCLPYSASLTSLPLEEADADIIHQSLNMSLEKSKTSKDVMNKIAYFAHLADNVLPTNLHVGFLLILYPRVLFPKVQNPPKNKFMIRKLSFYINLVHDVENTYKQHIHEVRIFEVERYHNSGSLQNSTNALQSTKVYKIGKNELKHEQVDQKPTGVYFGGYKIITENPQRHNNETFGQEVNLNSIVNISECSSTINRKPLRALRFNPQRQLIYNTSRELEYNKCPPTKKLQHYSSEARKKNVSKIPVYKYYTHKSLYRKENIQYEPDVYEISSQSLPREENSITQGFEAKYHNLLANEKEVTSPVVLWKPQNDLLETENLQHTNYDLGASSVLMNKHMTEMGNCPEIQSDSKSSEDSLDLSFNDYFCDANLSRPITYKKQNSSRVLKQRKKKSEFLLTKSRSEIYLTESRQDIQFINVASDEINKNKRIGACRNDTLSKIQLEKYLDGDLKISNSTIQYVTRLFYESLLKDVFLDERKDTILEVQDSTSSCTETAKNKYLDKILSNIKQRIVEETAKQPPTRFLSQPNVEAGMDDDDVPGQIQITRMKSIHQEINGDHLITNYFENNICQILKRGISKSCQMPDILVAEMKNRLESINDLPLTDPRNSCDNFENFVVMFDSKTSTSVLSSRRDRSFEDIIDDSIKYSLLNEQSISRMRSLMKTEYGVLMRKIMETTPWKAMGMEPIQYFVYQHCNCNKSETFLEKLRAKSRAFIKSSCLKPANKCIVKYKNNRMLRGLQSNEDCSDLICQKCGCYISNSAPKKNLNLTNYCSCTCPTHFEGNNSAMHSSSPHHEGTVEPHDHTGKHETTNKKHNSTPKSSSHQDKTGKSEKTVKEPIQEEDTDYPLCKCCKSGCGHCGHCTCKQRKPSCKTRLMSKLEQCSTALKGMPKKCMSSKKVGDELCLCRDTKNVGVRCLPDNVNVGVCTHFAEPKPKGRPCSHCLGQHDKSVDTKPSCRNTGIQCYSSGQMEKGVECDSTNTSIISGNKSMPSTNKALTPESSISSKNSHDSNKTKEHHNETKDHNMSKKSSNHSSTTHDTSGFHSAIDDDDDDE